jgi:hypothetical protein
VQLFGVAIVFLLVGITLLVLVRSETSRSARRARGLLGEHDRGSSAADRRRDRT